MDRIEDYQVIEFISVGGESIVFKAVKKSVGRTYAMKFRSTEFWNEFQNYELNTFSALEQCSASKVAGMIQIIPNALQHQLFEMIPESYQHIENCQNLISPYMQFFCIIEDYIPGCNLEEYCKGVPEKKIPAHTPPVNAPNDKQHYDDVVAFQRKLLNWTKQFCEIMIRITNEKCYVHLDIKPDNIMILPETESLVIVDFGKALKVPAPEAPISLRKEFNRQEVGLYGTPGYAAPECCDDIDVRRALRYMNTGTADIRSDIFSFGATLWQCINVGSGVEIQMAEEGYFERNLFNTPPGYAPELEEIIVTCTKKNPEQRYQSYEELKQAAVNAEKKLALRDRPTIWFWIVMGLTILFAIALVLSLVIDKRREGLTFEIAVKNFQEMKTSYSEHNISDYKETALALLEADNTREQSYFDILEVSYLQDDSISYEEFNDVLMNCVSQTDNQKIKEQYTDTIMQHVSEQHIRSIAESIALKQNQTLSGIDRCKGYQIANAITKYTETPDSSYQTLLRYKDDAEYATSLQYLAKILQNDSNLTKQIAEDEGDTQENITNELQKIKDGEPDGAVERD